MRILVENLDKKTQVGIAVDMGHWRNAMRLPVNEDLSDLQAQLRKAAHDLLIEPQKVVHALRSFADWIERNAQGRSL
jgi:hypothetical protein